MTSAPPATGGKNNADIFELKNWHHNFDVCSNPVSKLAVLSLSSSNIRNTYPAAIQDPILCHLPKAIPVTAVFWKETTIGSDTDTSTTTAMAEDTPDYGDLTQSSDGEEDDFWLAEDMGPLTVPSARRRRILTSDDEDESLAEPALDDG